MLGYPGRLDQTVLYPNREHTHVDYYLSRNYSDGCRYLRFSFFST